MGGSASVDATNLGFCSTVLFISEKESAFKMGLHSSKMSCLRVECIYKYNVCTHMYFTKSDHRVHTRFAN